MRYQIAPCGMDCTLCLGYQREKRKCPGCLAPDAEQVLKHAVTCLIKRCDQRSGDHCYTCESFPCARLRRLDTRYQKRYGMSMIENLEMIRDKGIAAFMDLEDSRWVCPHCGGILCVHRDVCLNCGYPNTLFPSGVH